MDNFNGVQVYNYEGRLLFNPKLGGLRTDFLNKQAVSLSKDFLAVLDRVDKRGMQFVAMLKR